MENIEKNGKETLKKILNKMVPSKDGQEIINDQLLNSLLTKLNELINSDEYQPKRPNDITKSHLEMFKKRYGLAGDSTELKPLETIAEEYHTTIERVRQAEALVLRKLTSANFIPRDERHPKR